MLMEAGHVCVSFHDHVISGFDKMCLHQKTKKRTNKQKKAKWVSGSAGFWVFDLSPSL
jgi:hypothetical protein